ncbi:unnamed protein product [Brassica oleracea]
MGAPERRNMPLLHPQRLNGGLCKNTIGILNITVRFVLTGKKFTKTQSETLRSHTKRGAKLIQRMPLQIQMTVEAGGVAPALTALVLKTHSSKDGTCIDKRAEGYVKAAEALALERSQSATATGENASAPSTQQLNAAYIETATNTKGRVYGLGSLQYVDADPKESPAASLRRNVGVDGRLTTVEGDAPLFRFYKLIWASAV